MSWVVTTESLKSPGQHDRPTVSRKCIHNRLDTPSHGVNWDHCSRQAVCVYTQSTDTRCSPPHTHTQGALGPHLLWGYLDFCLGGRRALFAYMPSSPRGVRKHSHTEDAFPRHVGISQSHAPQSLQLPLHSHHDTRNKEGEGHEGSCTDTQQTGRAWFRRAPNLISRSWSQDSRLLTATGTLLVDMAAVATFLKETLAAELCYYVFI